MAVLISLPNVGVTTAGRIHSLPNGSLGNSMPIEQHGKQDTLEASDSSICKSCLMSRIGKKPNNTHRSFHCKQNLLRLLFTIMN